MNLEDRFPNSTTLPSTPASQLGDNDWDFPFNRPVPLDSNTPNVDGTIEVAAPAFGRTPDGTLMIKKTGVGTGGWETVSTVESGAHLDLGNVPNGSVLTRHLAAEVLASLAGGMDPADFLGNITALSQNLADPTTSSGKWYFVNGVAGTMAGSNPPGSDVEDGGFVFSDGSTWNTRAAAPVVIPAGFIDTDKIGSDFRKTVLVRNIAHDGSGELQAGVFQALSLPTVSAHTELQAVGIINSHQFSSGAGTGFYKREQLEQIEGKTFHCSVYLYSGTQDFPAQMSAYFYDVSDGGSIIPGSSRLSSGFEQITANLRRYYARYSAPDVPGIVSVAYGFDTTPTDTAAEIGGWAMAETIGLHLEDSIIPNDWNGYGSRDSFRDSQNDILSDLEVNAVKQGLLPNSLINPNFDPAGASPSYSGTPALADPPTSSLMQEKNIFSAMMIGDGGAQVYPRFKIQSDDSNGKYWAASAYVYSSTGLDWPELKVYWYKAGSTYAGGIDFSGFIEVDTNNRIYYAAGQWGASDDPDEIRPGVSSQLVSGANVEIGGFSYAENGSLISHTDIKKDDWYSEYTTDMKAAERGRKVDEIYPKIMPMDGKTVAYFGDSITESYDVPETLQGLVGGTVLNFGFGGCRLSKGTTTDPGQVNNFTKWMSQVAVAQNVLSGDFTTLTDAADGLFALNGDDNRPQAAAIAAQDWNAVDFVLMDWGTNDYSGNRALGLASSTNDNEFNGAINLTVERLLTAYPHLRLVFITPMWRGAGSTLGDSNLNTNGNGDSISAFQDALMERGRYYQIPVCPMHELVGINEFNKSTYLADDLHPTKPAGSDRKAATLAAWLKSKFA